MRSTAAEPADTMSSIRNGSFTIDFPDVDSQGFCLTEDRDWTGYTENIPVRPVQGLERIVLLYR